MTAEELKQEITSNKFPTSWRKGQSVFNYIDRVYGVARKVQFEDNIDCFYNGDSIDDFINASIKYINNGN